MRFNYTKFLNNSIPADNSFQARLWLRLSQDLNKDRDFIRELRENNYSDFLGSNTGIVLDYVLRKMQCSKDGSFFASRDRIALETGIPEKTAEYCLNRLCEAGIFRIQMFKSERNPKFLRKCLMINVSFRKRMKKDLGLNLVKSKKNVPESICPKLDLSTPKQDNDLVSFSFSCAVSLLTGQLGFKLGVYPTLGKLLKLYDGDLNYKKLSKSKKLEFLKEWVDKSGSGWSIRIPKGYMMIDCDSRDSFERMLMEYYCGGFIVKSPRGGKILVKHSGDIPKRDGDIEYHGTGRFAVCAGDGYEFMSFEEPGNFIKTTNLTKSGNIKKERKEFNFEELSFSDNLGVGSRNEYLFRLGRSLKMKGMDREGLLEEFNTLNKEFSQPLPQSEVEYLARHVFKYKNRKNFRIFVSAV